MLIKHNVNYLINSSCFPGATVGHVATRKATRWYAPNAGAGAAGANTKTRRP